MIESNQYWSADHVMLEAPVPIPTLKLRKIGPGYLVLRWETAPGADKNQSQAMLWFDVSQTDGRQTLSSCTGSGKVLTVFRTLASDCCKAVPQSTGHGLTVWSYENGQILYGMAAN